MNFCAEAPVSAIFEPFRTADPARPFVAAQLGQSLDGRIATITGESRYINGEAALDHLHALRAHVDAVLVGAGTVAADDPQLTVRRGPLAAKPARVVVDPVGRLGAGKKWLADDGARRILIGGPSAGELQGAELVRLPLRNGLMAPGDIVETLFRLGLRRLLIEGGSKTISAVIDAGCVDRLHVLVAPLIIGSGKPGLEMTPIEALDRAIRPPTRVFPLADGDVLFDCDLSGCRKD